MYKMETYLVSHTKPIIICLFKSICSDLLQKYGKVVRYESVYTNIQIDQIEFDYFIIDLRQEEDRFYYRRHIMYHYDDYFYLLYRYCFETNQGLFFHNEITELPPYQINKEEYDTLLLKPIIPVPNCFISLIRYICK